MHGLPCIEDEKEGDWHMENILSFFRLIAGMKLTDYLDIAIVAFIIYHMLRLVQATNSSRIVGAVVVIIVASWFSGIVNMHTVNFILSSLLQIGIIALVILFQPELRRMLDHLGSVRLAKILTPEKAREDMTPVIKQTVQACEVMSREKIGALIVFARESRMDEYFKTGTMINGEVSEQLLRNIFFPKAALHDGATIVCDGKVAAAGCVLPLSESNRLSADMGTRHRAGVGMSEVSDAVVVIVSEETGTISVAVGGMLKRHLAPQTLERLLMHELCPEPQDVETLPLRLKQKLLKKDKEEQK